MSNRFLIIILVIAFILNAGFYQLERNMPQFSFPLLTGGNIIMALLSVMTYFIVKKQIRERPEAFVRGVYGATFLKLMVCMAGILIYVMIYRKTLHKPSLFVLFGIYAVYTTAETWMLQKMARST